MHKLNIENPFFEFMGRIGDVCLANILFVLCCIPVITIPASFSALYGVLLEMKDVEKSISVSQLFFHYFKSNLKNKLLIGVIYLLTGGLLLFDILFLGSMNQNGPWKLMNLFIGGLLLLWILITTQLFPLLTRMTGSVKVLIKKSFFLSIFFLPKTIIMAILNLIPVICFILGNYFIGIVTPLYLVFGFGATAYVNMNLLPKEISTKCNQYQ